MIIIVKYLINKLKLKVYNYKLNKIKKSFRSIGKNCDIMLGTFGDAYNIIVGDNVYIGPEAYFWAAGGITIGNNISFGPRVSIHTINHRYEGAFAIPYDGVSIRKPVTIKDNVWIGGHVCIVPGVTIEEGALVAMGSVVTKDVPKCAIVGGNPARIIKYRNIENYEKLKKEEMFWNKLSHEKVVNYIIVDTKEDASNIKKEQLLNIKLKKEQ